MIVKIEYWSPRNESMVTKDGFRYRDTKSVCKEVRSWEDSKLEIFRKFDKQNNRLKYCNGSCYKFEDKAIHNEYREWYQSLDKSVQFEMYYGNGIVD